MKKLKSLLVTFPPLNKQKFEMATLKIESELTYFAWPPSWDIYRSIPRDLNLNAQILTQILKAQVDGSPILVEEIVKMLREQQSPKVEKVGFVVNEEGFFDSIEEEENCNDKNEQG